MLFGSNSPRFGWMTTFRQGNRRDVQNESSNEFVTFLNIYLDILETTQFLHFGRETHFAGQS